MPSTSMVWEISYSSHFSIYVRPSSHPWVGKTVFWLPIKICKWQEAAEDYQMDIYYQIGNPNISNANNPAYSDNSINKPDNISTCQNHIYLF